jgi:glycosyltransferase involved in cell wall biosynthesis
VPEPLVSVVIASVNGLACVSACLEALAPQMEGRRAEVLVVDRCGEETRAALRRRFPAVRVVAAEGGSSLAELRRQGLAQARGRLLAVLADRFVPAPGWLEAVEEAHRKGRQVFGGAVENASPARALDWAVFLCEYAPFMPPLAEGEAAAIPGNNAVYDRTVLDRLGGGTTGEAWDGFLHDRIRALGVPLWAEPGLRVAQGKRYAYVPFLAERYHAGRAFAATRLLAAPLLKRVAYALGTPFLPPLLLKRLFVVVLRKGRHRARLLSALPFILTFLVSGACGEAVGALFGAGRSFERLS